MKHARPVAQLHALRRQNLSPASARRLAAFAGGQARASWMAHAQALVGWVIAWLWLGLLGARAAAAASEGVAPSALLLLVNQVAVLHG